MKQDILVQVNAGDATQKWLWAYSQMAGKPSFD